MDGEEAARFRIRARELRELAKLMKNPEHRGLLLESAESFEKLARHVLDVEPQR